MVRRGFLKLTGLAAVAAAVPFQVACSLKDVYKQVAAYVPVALQAFASVISILSGAGVISAPISVLIDAAIALVKVGFADLLKAVSDYEAAEASAKPGLIGAISSALLVAEQDIQAFWNDLAIPDVQLAQLIEGLLGVITTTLAGFAAALPTTTTSVAMKTYPRMIKGAPKRRSVGDFRKDFNAILSQYGKGQYAIK